MRKIISLLAIPLLCSALLYPQAAVDIPLILDDGNPYYDITLHFGLDLTATDSIDSHLGEFHIQILPPAGILEARFDLTPYNSIYIHSYKDYRNAPAFPFTGLKQHRLIWQLSAGATALNIVYNMPGYATMLIQDELTGTLINSGILSGSGIFPVTFPVTALKLTISYTNALPVELTGFTGIQEGSAVKLNWTTASETNNKGFELERKIQNSAWEIISFIEGYGTTAAMQSYSYSDELPGNVSGSIFYRLRQIDYDGSEAYSDELEIKFTSPDNFALYQNYPNPFNPVTTISYSIPEYSEVIIKVTDLLGNEIETLVDEAKPAGRYEITWNAAGLASGVYFYQLTTVSYDRQVGSFIETRKTILMK